MLLIKFLGFLDSFEHCMLIFLDIFVNSKCYQEFGRQSNQRKTLSAKNTGLLYTNSFYLRMQTHSLCFALIF